MRPQLSSSRPIFASSATIRRSHASASCMPGAERVALHLRDRRVRRVLEPAERPLDREDAVDIGPSPARVAGAGAAARGRRRAS